LQICQNSNELALVDLEKTNKEYVFLQKNNKDLQIENEKIQANITELGIEIEKVQQRAQINEILKDVDLDELKMLSQNNLTVNSAIANLVSKLDIIEGK
jgi:ribosomal protein L12E/L44/L45/RPP1/RPP2